MPISKYYKGRGEEVLKGMVERYGPEEGRSVFYATAKERDMNPEDNEDDMKKAASQIGYFDGYLSKTAGDAAFKKRLMTWLMAQKSDPRKAKQYFHNIVKTAPVDWKRFAIQKGYIEKQVAKDKMKPGAVHATRWLARGTRHLPKTHANEKMKNPYNRFTSPKRRAGYNKAFETMLPALLAEIEKDPKYFDKMKYIMAGKPVPKPSPVSALSKSITKNTPDNSVTAVLKK